ncbi:MAG: lipoxygenase family protein [Sandaracinus sp.]
MIEELVEALLPHHETTPEARAAELAAARDTYRYAYDWPPEVATAAEVPRADTYSAGYIAALLPSAWDIFKNTIGLLDIVEEREGLTKFFEDEAHRVVSLKPGDIGDWYLRVANDLARYVAQRTPPTLDGYDSLYPKLLAPTVGGKWQDDRTFAWQRIAGVNPMTLTRITEMPKEIGIGQSEYARVFGTDGSFDAALAEGRVFACDYTFLDGVPTGKTFGNPKWLPAVYATFVAKDGELQPLAVHLGKRLGSRNVTPKDGELWKIGKLATHIGDANHHETVSHLGRTHLVMEAVALALKRQLSSRHPLHRLLWPHCEFTLPINHSAATNLIAPGGAIDAVFGGTIEASASFVKKGLDSFDLSRAGVAADLAARGLDDRAILRDHPYRDDALPVVAAIRRFVDSYVHLFYASDADVVADVELAAFLTELGATDGGRIRGVPRPQTIEGLVDLVTSLVWIASGQHAAVNFTQYPFMGCVPNMIGALWNQWPPANLDEAGLYAKLLPPYNLAVLQLHTVYQLSSLRVNHLGKYGLTTFLDGRVREAIATFQKDLEEVEQASKERDEKRWISYPHLFPSNIPQSIHI